MNSAKPDRCKGCPLYSDGTGFVRSSGEKSQPIWIWGQAPGSRELDEDLPFCGPAGHMLWQATAPFGKSRDDFYIDNTVRCKPPKVRGADYIPPEAVAHCEAAHGPFAGGGPTPKLILTLGGVALKRFTGKSDIERWRGSLHLASQLPSEVSIGRVVEYDPSLVFKSGKNKGKPKPFKVDCYLPQQAPALMPTYHPSYINKGNHHLIGVFMHDIRTALRFASGAWKRGTLKYFKCVNPTELQNRVSAELPLIVDIETDMATDKITLIGLSNPGGEVCCIYPSPIMLKAFFEIYKSAPEIIAHNGVGFDFERLENLYEETNNLIATLSNSSQLFIDTMLAWGVCEPDLKKSLAYSSACVDEGTFYWKDDKNFLRYNARDVERCDTVYQYVKTELKSRGAEPIFNHIQVAYRNLKWATKRGVTLDPKVRSKLTDQYTKQLELNGAVVSSLIGIEPGEQKKLLKYFGIKKLDAAALNRVAHDDQSKGPLVNHLLKWREAQKYLTTYLNIPVDERNMIHPEFLPVTADNEENHGPRATGRTACRNPNIQNFPEEMRRMVVAQPGNRLYSIDFNQIEWQLINWDALGKLAKGDIHRQFAALVLGKESYAVTDEERKRHKPFVYGKMYDMGKFTMQESLLKYGVYMSVKECDEKLKAVDKLLPWLAPYKAGVVAKALKQGYLENPFKMRRNFYHRQQARQAINFYPQSTVAGLLFMLLSDGHVTPLMEHNLWAVVHDEVDLECPQLHTATRNYINVALEQACSKYMPGFNVGITIKEGLNWAEMTTI